MRRVVDAPRTRQIGPWGTVARVGVGTFFIVEAAPAATARQALLGLVVMPAAVTIALAIRGRDAPPLRLDALPWHAANLAIFFVSWTLQDEATLLFYGSAMLLAAWRGIGACEIFVVSNAIRRRDDQLGCPLFLPVDAAEARA